MLKRIFVGKHPQDSHLKEVSSSIFSNGSSYLRLNDPERAYGNGMITTVCYPVPRVSLPRIKLTQQETAPVFRHPNFPAFHQRPEQLRNSIIRLNSSTLPVSFADADIHHEHFRGLPHLPIPSLADYRRLAILRVYSG